MKGNYESMLKWFGCGILVSLTGYLLYKLIRKTVQLKPITQQELIVVEKIDKSVQTIDTHEEEENEVRQCIDELCLKVEDLIIKLEISQFVNDVLHRMNQKIIKENMEEIINELCDNAIIASQIRSEMNSLVYEIICNAAELVENEIIHQQSLELSRKLLFNKTRRNYILQEFMETEISYVNNLHLLKIHYIEPSKKFLSPKTIKTIFGQLEIIIKLNEHFLEDLKKALEIKDDSREYEFAKLLKKFAPLFKSYTLFITNYNDSISALSESMKRNKSYFEYMETKRIELQKKYRISHVKSFLITPVQRLPRYELFLDDLLLHSDDEKLSKLLKEALELVKASTEHCNKRQLEHEKNLRMKQLQNELGIRNLFTPWRRFECESSLLRCRKIRKTGRLGKMVECKLYLFTDILVIVRKRVLNSKLMVLPLHPQNFYIGAHHNESCTFQINVPNELQLRVYCHSNKDRDNWISIIQELINQQKMKRLSSEWESNLRRLRSNTLKTSISLQLRRHQHSTSL